MRFLFWTLRLGLISSAVTLAAMAIVVLWVYFHPIHKITTHLWGTCPSEIDGDYSIIDIDGEKLRLPTELIESCYAPYARRTIFDDPRTVTLSGNLSDFAKFTDQTDPLQIGPPIKVTISGKIPGVRYQNKTVDELNSISLADLNNYLEAAPEGATPQFRKSDKKFLNFIWYAKNRGDLFIDYDFLIATDELGEVEYFLTCHPGGELEFEFCYSNRHYLREKLHIFAKFDATYIDNYDSIYDLLNKFNHLTTIQNK